MTEREIGELSKLPLEEVLRTGVNDALPMIWERRENFTSEEKPVLGDRIEDFCTNVDQEVQQMLVDKFRSQLPGFGLVCEEDAPGLKPWDGRGPFLTIDSMDGTIPFRKGNLRFVGVMAAAALGQEVLAACIGEVTTGDTYSYGPGMEGVVHTSGRLRKMLPMHTEPEGYRPDLALLRRILKKHKGVTQRFIEGCPDRQIKGFHDHQITGESFATATPRLWKREVRTIVLWHGTKETPWDMIPIIGISKRLGYVFLRTTEDEEAFEVYEPVLPTSCYVRGHDTVIIHKEDLYLIEPFMRT